LGFLKKFGDFSAKKLVPSNFKRSGSPDKSKIAKKCEKISAGEKNEAIVS